MTVLVTSILCVFGKVCFAKVYPSLDGGVHSTCSSGSRLTRICYVHLGGYSTSCTLETAVLFSPLFSCTNCYLLFVICSWRSWVYWTPDPYTETSGILPQYRNIFSSCVTPWMITSSSSMETKIKVRARHCNSISIVYHDTWRPIPGASGVPSRVILSW